MRAASIRSRIRSSMWSAWPSMMRKNCCTSAGSSTDDARSTAAAEPLMEVRGARSSWLTMARNSARCSCNSSKGVRSCRVTTTVSTVPSSVGMGVALMMVVTLRPSGTPITISSARTVSPLLSAWASGNSAREISRPSARRKVSSSSRSSGDWSGLRRLSTIRRVSRLKDSGAPVPASKTITPTGAVLIRVSRSALDRCSSRSRRALAMAIAA